MGLRSWLTSAASWEEFEKIYTSIEENPYANGVHYILKVEKECPFKIGDIVIAWSGDGSSSVNLLLPENNRKHTWLLDNFTESFPEWHTEPGGPEKFGRMLINEDEVRKAFE